MPIYSQHFIPDTDYPQVIAYQQYMLENFRCSLKTPGKYLNICLRLLPQLDMVFAYLTLSQISTYTVSYPLSRNLPTILEIFVRYFSVCSFIFDTVYL